MISSDPTRVAILLYDADSANKLAQTLLELVRGGLATLPLRATVFVLDEQPLDAVFINALPFPVRSVRGTVDGDDGHTAFLAVVTAESFDQVALFESSGMYRGEDLVGLLARAATGQLAAVWGSRRLSVRDIEESLRMRYRKTPVLAALSSFGSHALSLLFLLLYGCYISDTLSGARVVRSQYLLQAGFGPTAERTNQRLLSTMLRQEGDILETPVQFLPMSPARVRRTTIVSGLRSLLSILWWRVR